MTRGRDQMRDSQAKRLPRLPGTGGDHAHLLWRVPEVEQFRSSHPSSLPATSSTSPLHHCDVLQVWRVYEELHLNTCALDDVTEEERRVLSSASNGQQDASKRRRRMRQCHGQDRPWQQLVGMSSGEEGGEDSAFFWSGQRFAQVRHESFPLQNILRRWNGGFWNDDCRARKWVRCGRGHEPGRSRSPGWFDKHTESGAGRNVPLHGLEILVDIQLIYT